MKKKKIILSYILGFLATFFLTAFLLLLIIKFTVNNKHYLYHLVQNNQYYDSIISEIQDEMESYIMSTGFNKDILNNLYTREEVINDLNLFIENSYKGNITILNKDNLKERIDKNIQEYLAKSKLDVLSKEDLLLFEDELKKIYVNEITLYEMANGVIIKYSKMNKFVNISLVIIGIILGSLIIVLRKINLYSLGVINLGSGLVVLFIQMAIYERIDMDNILIITEEFSKLIRITLNHINKMMLLEGILLIIGGIWQTFWYSLKKRVKKS